MPIPDLSPHAITLLQEGSLLTLAVLLSSYGSLNLLVSSLRTFIQSYDVMNRMFLLHSCDICDLIGAAIYL